MGDTNQIRPTNLLVSGTPYVDIRAMSPTVDISDGTVSAVAALAAAAAIGSPVLIPPGTYLIDSSCSCTASLIMSGGKFSVTSGATLTLTGALEARPVQLFAGGGAVSFTGNASIPEVYPQWWGAKGDGVTDDRAAVQAAVDASAGALGAAVVEFPGGSYVLSGSVSVPEARISFRGYGAKIIQTGSLPSFTKTGYSYALFEGFWFTGNGSGIKVLRNPALAQACDLRVRDCRYEMDTGVYGLWLEGSSEPFISDCDFKGSGSGVYLKSTVSPVIRNCQFRGVPYTGKAIFYDGAHGYSSGLVLDSCEIMNYEYGVHAVGVDFIHASANTIDFNKYSLDLNDIDGGAFVGNYCGNNIDVSSNIPVLTLTSCTNMRFVGNTFLSHPEVAGRDAIKITGDSTRIFFIGNEISYWTRYGIDCNASAPQMHISNNLFSASASGTNFFADTGITDDGWILINDNIVDGSKPATGLDFSRIINNSGYRSENSGEIYTDGINVNINVSHGLRGRPDSVLITSGSDVNAYVSFVGASIFTITLASAAGVYPIQWRAEKNKGS